MFRPLEIKTIELSSEYIMFFGKSYNRFKTPYIVKFDAQSINGASLINSQMQSIEMIFSRPNRKAFVTWCLDSCGNVIKRNIKKHKDVLAYDLDCC